jgi:hypothetical protein
MCINIGTHNPSGITTRARIIMYSSDKAPKRCDFRLKSDLFRRGNAIIRPNLNPIPVFYISNIGFVSTIALTKPSDCSCVKVRGRVRVQTNSGSAQAGSRRKMSVIR